MLTDPSVPEKEKETLAPQVIPLKDEGSAFTAEVALTKGLVYRIEAKTTDGRLLPRNRYRIDVRDDRAPRVAFEEPGEALEVHAIAEVRNRIRAGDDFGLTRAGIVFQFNDGAEQTLVAREFTEPPPEEPLQTSAALEEMLLLEKLAASSTDSVTYFAFAEDNDPAGPKRTETDLRYIDIRPFKREYKKGEAGDQSGGESTSLGELIARQRFNLNRGNRLARRRTGDKSPAEDPLKIAGFEETLAGLTREFTEGIEGIVGQRVEPLHQAEEAMLAAVEAIDRGRNGGAPKLMAEALRHLIESRRSLQIIIGDDAAAAAAVRKFDRTQAQKIRKDKNKDDEAAEIADQIEDLAKEEDFIYVTLDESADSSEPSPKGESPEKPAEKPGDSPKGSSGQGQSKGEGEAREKGEPGESKKVDPREMTAKQEKIVDELRGLEEKLKRLEEASDLAKARMAKAAEEADKASGALVRGNTKEATRSARAGAMMLHELARQVKGEIAREVAEELAMARDLAAELAEREAKLGQMPDNAPGDPGKPGASKKDGKNGGAGGAADQNEALREAARTLAEWLKGASRRAEGDAAERLREVSDESPMTRIVERVDRVGELVVAGQKAGGAQGGQGGRSIAGSALSPARRAPPRDRRARDREARRV